jgi:hypothetical protein
MKKILGPLLGALLIAAMPVSAQAQPASAPKAEGVNPASLAIAHQILSIGMPPENRSQMLGSVVDSLVEQIRKSSENLGLTKDKDFQAVMDRSTHRMWDEMKPIMNAALPDIFENMAHAYAREFSIDDLNALLAFVKTPAGQHFFERAPMILKDPDVQAANQRMIAQFAGKMPEIMRENQQDIEEYVARKQKEKKTAEPVPIG